MCISSTGFSLCNIFRTNVWLLLLDKVFNGPRQRDLQVIEAEEIDHRSTEADVNVGRRSIELFFFFSFFLQSSDNFRFAFLALKVVSQAFT